ncbi:hypothetical protein HQQ81_01990 [Microbacteriaceae bacterium VKM Ac-2854]|nr:hypothetical protein [Microbacteriaceae bacterium VKM Ac-2854]
MPPMLTLAMLAPAGLAACCVAADPHRRAARVWLPAALMLAAMLEHTLLGLLPGLLWAVVVAAGAALSVLAGRLAGGVDGMQLHRAISGLVMAVLLLGSAASASSGDRHTHGAGQHGSALQGTVTLAVVALLVGGIALCVRELRGRSGRIRPLLAAEPVLMSFAIAVMTIAH